MKSGGGTVESSFDGPPSVAVVEAIAETEGVSAAAVGPQEYPVLYEAIDPQALDNLFSTGPESKPLTIKFTYGPYTVTVTSDGTVTLAPHET